MKDNATTEHEYSIIIKPMPYDDRFKIKKCKMGISLAPIRAIPTFDLSVLRNRLQKQIDLFDD